MRNARRSVSDRDLQQYSSFAQTLQQARSQMTGALLVVVSFLAGCWPLESNPTQSTTQHADPPTNTPLYPYT